MTRMKKRRLRSLPYWLGAAYLAWSIFIYYPREQGDLHSWWPLFLYPLIWPLSLAIETALRAVQPALGDTDSGFRVYDHLAGGLYIVGGTGWWWCLGRLASKVATRKWPLAQVDPRQPKGVIPPA